MDTIEGAGNGSVFAEISKSSFKELDFAIPSPSKIEQFDRSAESIFSKIRQNSIIIQKLTLMRDTLLPKLLSGEARVKMK